MEKLIELLNEYVEKYNKSDLYYKFELENWELYCYNDVSDVLWTMQDEAMVICSKKYWFIKWLVENEKIDYEKVREWEWNGSKWYFETVQPEHFILMLLAIQDEPIRFLCDILK